MDYRRRTTKGKTVLGIMIALLLVIFAVVGYFFLREPDVKEAYNDTIYADIEGLDEAAVYGRIGGEAWGGEINEPYEFTYRINNAPKFNDSKNAGTLMFENSKSNTHFMAVEITLDGGQLVFRSGIIPPGYFIGSDKLDTQVEDGVYQGTVVISVIDPKEMYVLDAFEEQITVTVGKK